jgi:dTDP-4-amino-4,6-dideoxygalactose transaminase
VQATSNATGASAPIPLVDLQSQYRSIRSDVLAAISDALDSMRLTLGPNVAAFEEEFAAYCGAAYCVGVGNGTDALILALRCLEIGPGDEVLVPGHTFIATAEAVSLTGATPIVVDVEQTSRCLDPRLIEQALTPRTRAVIAVHMHGQTADMDAIGAIAKRNGLCTIEDAAQAHGAELHGSRAGGLADLGCFSFYCSKNLGAYGEAGALTTNDAVLAERLRQLRSHGESDHYEHARLGTNSRLDEIQAAILRIKLRRLEEWNAMRRVNAERLSRLLSGLPIELPTEVDDRKHVYHHYAVLAPDRNGLRNRLRERGIATGVHYPLPIHLQPPYRTLGLRRGDLPVSEGITDRVLSLPMYAELSSEQLERIAGAVHEAYETAG